MLIFYPLSIFEFKRILISMKSFCSILSFLLAFIFIFSQTSFAQSIALTAPISGNLYGNNLALNFTITEPSGSPQSVKLEMTNTVSSISYEYTLASAAVSQNLSLPISSLSVPDGNYNMFLRYVRPVGAGGGNIDSGVVNNVTLDSVTTPPNLTSPTSTTTIQFITLTYTLPEVPASNSVTVTFTDGGSNIGVLNMNTTQSVSRQIDLRGTSFPAEVTSFSGFPLADATYTVYLAYQDQFLNPSSLVNVSGITLAQPTPTPTPTPTDTPTPTPTETPTPTNTPTPTPTPTVTPTTTPTVDPYKLTLSVIDKDSKSLGSTLLSIDNLGTYFTDNNGLFEKVFSPLNGDPKRSVTVAAKKSRYSFPVKLTSLGTSDTLIGEKLSGKTDGCSSKNLISIHKKRASTANQFILKMNSTFTDLFAQIELIKNDKLKSRTTSLYKKSLKYFTQYQKAELSLPTEIFTCKKKPTCKIISYTSSLTKISDLTDKFSDIVNQLALIMSDKEIGLKNPGAKFKKSANSQLKKIADQIKSFPKNKIACK